jgi:phenylalanyl-tRNA synthetase alpha chain
VGKKGEISLKMRELGKMTPEERQVAGPALNALKDEINARSPPRRPRWPMPRWMSGCAPNGST